MANNFPALRPSLNLDFANMGVLDPRVTFTRASASGGYYDGKTFVKAEENLFTQSASFPASGGVSAGAVNNGDGTVSFSAASNEASVGGVTLSSGDVFTVSVYLSGTGTVRIQALHGAGTGFGDDETVVLSATPTRRILTRTSASAGVGHGFRLLGAGDNSPATVRIEKFQLEKRAFATAYTATTTQPITRYQPKMLFAAANEPVFRHDPVTGEAKGLRVKPAATNLILRNTDFANSYWSKQDVDVKSNQIIAPDGTLTADLVVPNTVTGTHQIFKLSVLSSATCAMSVYAKAGGYSTFQILDGSTAANGAAFNLSAGTVSNIGSGVGYIENVGNGWYQCSVVAATTGLRIYIPNSGSSVTGDGYSGVYLWAAGLNTGSVASPAILTEASTVTIAADNPVMTGDNFSSWFNAGEGTIVVEFESDLPAETSTAMVPYSINNSASSSTNAIQLREATGYSPDRLFPFVIANGTTQFSGEGAGFKNYPLGTTKSALSYKTNDLKHCFDGGSVTTSTGVLPVVNQLAFGGHGNIKRFTYYPIASTSATTQAVTR